MMDQDLRPLEGGNMSQVVKSGNRVLRTATPASKTIQEFLRHLRNEGIDWVPEPLGFDDSGKEILSYIPGTVLDGVAPDWFWEERIMIDAAKRLRQLHDASVSFKTFSDWNYESMDPAEVIIHRDFAPYNCIYEAEQFVGLIDFDLCGPGPRLWDIVYTAYRFVPLMPLGSGDLTSPFTPDVMLRRLEVFLSAYDFGFSASEVIKVTQNRLDAMIEWIEEWVKAHPNSELKRNRTIYLDHRNWLGEICESQT